MRDDNKYGLDSAPWEVTPVVQNDGYTVEYHANNTETNDYFRSTDLKYVQQTVGAKASKADASSTDNGKDKA